MTHPPPGQYPPPPPQSPPPSNWMVGAILSLLCCWPLGIPSVVYASRVHSAWNAGDYQGAEEAGQKAKKWGISALVLGVLTYIVFGIMWVVFLGAMFAATDNAITEMEQIEQEMNQELEDFEIEDLEVE